MDSENKKEKFAKNPRVEQLITSEKYGEYAPIIREYLNRTLNEFELSPEFVDLFVNSCDNIKLCKLPKEWKECAGLTTRPKKLIRINKDYYRQQKGNLPEKDLYKMEAHVLCHEMQHMLLQRMDGVDTGLMEAITEVAANRISYGKNKEQMKNYRNETLGYGNLTFGVNILAAAMGKSEKEFLKLAYGNKIYETVTEQLNSQTLAGEFLFAINQEIENIRIASSDKSISKEELKAIQTKAYHSLYIYGKNYLNRRIAVMNIESDINNLTESLKYSSNKLTRILMTELSNRGNMKLKPSFHYLNGISFIVRSPEKTDKIQREERNTLNAKIAILDRVSNEFKENPIFQGEDGKEKQKKVLLYIRKFAYSTKDIIYMNNIFKKRLNLDLSDTFAEFINSKYEKHFELKPETIEKIEREDFCTSYDENDTELMKRALKPSFKTRIKNSFLKVRGKIFKHKSKLLLTEAIDIGDKIRPIYYVEKEEEKKKENYLENENAAQRQSWSLNSSDREAIQKANEMFAKKYENEQRRNNIDSKDNKNIKSYEEH